MTEITISVEAAFTILIGFVGLIITLAAGYASLRERIISNEIHAQHMQNDISELKQLFYEVMKALNVKPRSNYEPQKGQMNGQLSQ